MRITSVNGVDVVDIRNEAIRHLGELVHLYKVLGEEAMISIVIRSGEGPTKDCLMVSTDDPRTLIEAMIEATEKEPASSMTIKGKICQDGKVTIELGEEVPNDRKYDTRRPTTIH